MAKLVAGETPKPFAPFTLLVETEEEARCLYLKLFPEFKSMENINSNPYQEAEFNGWNMPSSEVDFHLWNLLADELSRQGMRKV